MKRLSGLIAFAAAVVAAPPLAAQEARLSLEAYLIADRDSEIALARSAAPEAISRDATILVLGHRGFEAAVKGSNGFVCLVERSWLGPFDFPDIWNPRIRGAQCLNPQAARSMLPLIKKRTAMYLDGLTTAQMIAATKALIAKREFPALEPGAMAYMMSRAAYLFDHGDHNGSHLMFYVPVARPQDWGVGAEHSPVVASASYWFMRPNVESAHFPPLVIYAIPVSQWSDGSPISR
jgi:hypothetical protein